MGGFKVSSMFELTLICTQHAEKGACNFNQLYQIVERIQPDVIFEELPPSVFEDYYVNKTRTNLETRTIIAYLEKYQIKHIPVDLEYEFSSNFFKQNGRLHRSVEHNSSDYRDLVDCNSNYTSQYGFRYLNSEYSIKNHAETYDAIEKTLEKLKDEKLFQIYKHWNEIIEKREQEMIRNINQYCHDFVFERGLFFIGAAHRRSIIEKIKVQFEDSEVTWHYEDYDNLF